MMDVNVHKDTPSLMDSVINAPGIMSLTPMSLNACHAETWDPTLCLMNHEPIVKPVKATWSPTSSANNAKYAPVSPFLIMIILHASHASAGKSPMAITPLVNVLPATPIADAPVDMSIIMELVNHVPAIPPLSITHVRHATGGKFLMVITPLVFVPMDKSISMEFVLHAPVTTSKETEGANLAPASLCLTPVELFALTAPETPFPITKTPPANHVQAIESPLLITPPVSASPGVSKITVIV